MISSKTSKKVKISLWLNQCNDTDEVIMGWALVDTDCGEYDLDPEGILKAKAGNLKQQMA